MCLFITKFYRECIVIKITLFCKIVCKLKYQQLKWAMMILHTLQLLECFICDKHGLWYPLSPSLLPERVLVLDLSRYLLSRFLSRDFFKSSTVYLFSPLTWPSRYCTSSLVKNVGTGQVMSAWTLLIESGYEAQQTSKEHVGTSTTVYNLWFSWYTPQSYVTKGIYWFVPPSEVNRCYALCTVGEKSEEKPTTKSCQAS